MKAIIISLCLLVPMHAHSAFCSEAAADEPCTPDGPDTDRRKSEILSSIKKAQDLEAEVEGLRRIALSMRNSSDEQRFDALEAYRLKKSVQDGYYSKAMEDTGLLYNVRPKAPSVRIAQPRDPSINYVTNLVANWEPMATNSGPGVKLAVRVKGRDGKYYYSGLVSMDPSQPDGLKALTLVNGQVLILKGVFTAALNEGNPGILASVIYHETLHFDRLSRPATKGSPKRRGWESPEEEEALAYTSNTAAADIFGVDDSDLRKKGTSTKKRWTTINCRPVRSRPKMRHSGRISTTIARSISTRSSRR